MADTSLVPSSYRYHSSHHNHHQLERVRPSSVQMASTPDTAQKVEINKQKASEENNTNAVPQLGALEEDDEFEEFEVDGECTSTRIRKRREIEHPLTL